MVELLTESSREIQLMVMLGFIHLVTIIFASLMIYRGLRSTPPLSNRGTGDSGGSGGSDGNDPNSPNSDGGLLLPTADQSSTRLRPPKKRITYPNPQRRPEHIPDPEPAREPVRS